MSKKKQSKYAEIGSLIKKSDNKDNVFSKTTKNGLTLIQRNKNLDLRYKSRPGALTPLHLSNQKPLSFFYFIFFHDYSFI
jgi:hypothetical protein